MGFRVNPPVCSSPVRSWGGEGLSGLALTPATPCTPVVPGSTSLASQHHAGAVGSRTWQDKATDAELTAEPAGCPGTAGRDQLTRGCPGSSGDKVVANLRRNRAAECRARSVAGSTPLPFPCASHLTFELRREKSLCPVYDHWNLIKH